MSEDKQDQKRPVGDRQIPQLGQVLCGVYRLDRILGWGAVGIVYAAWHMELRRACAVKILHPNFVDNEDVRERFRREALSAFKLKHPHIIHILDFREDETGWPLIIMELLHGESLRQRLGRGALSLALTEKLYVQMCEAMDLAHRHGIVHRDLKPENIFLMRQRQQDGNETDVVKILDFGISKVTDHPEITAVHVLLGSPSYMSPEQARGDARTVDARADIFSMGVVLFECLTGRKAFVSADPEQKRQLILGGSVPSLRETSPELPIGLSDLLRKACAVAPEDRFQSAIEMQAALLVALKTEPADLYAQRQGETGARGARPERRTPAPEQKLSAENTLVLQAVAAPAESTMGITPDMMMEDPEVAENTATVIVLPKIEVPDSLVSSQTFIVDPVVQSEPSPGPGDPGKALAGDAKAAQEKGEAEKMSMAESLTARVVEKLAGRLKRWPEAAEGVRRAGKIVRGREMLFLVPIIFILVFGVLAVIDWQCNGPLTPTLTGKPVGPGPKKIEVIDGQKGKRRQ